jgi:hypothetical protein
LAKKHTDVALEAPILSWLNIRSGGSVSADLAKLAARGRLADLEKEISALRKQVAKAGIGQADLRLRLAEVEERAERVAEADLKRVYEREAAELRKAIEAG